MRKSGLLLHITSLPSKFGIGDLGPQAFRFADFLAKAKQRCWQILPLNPPAPPRYSPYNSFSAFAGNTTLISPQLLYRDGFLTKQDIQNTPGFAKSKVEYEKVIAFKTKLLNTAFERFKNSRKHRYYERFCFENRGWLDDYSLFAALRNHFRPRLWRDWPVELRERWEKPLAATRAKFQEAINREKFLQYLFCSQWFSLKEYCNQLGISIIGDIPFYVAYDSADVWSHPEIFKLNRYRNPLFISGVPPDIFSRTGQLWGNPVYHWLALKKKKYSWWFERLRHNLKLFDRVRIDHFRGFFRFWQVPATGKNAIKGKWAKAPGKEFLDLVFKRRQAPQGAACAASCGRFPKQSIIAEDLGYITPDVRSYVEDAKLAGMRVLQFGFGGNPKTNPHYPPNHVRNSVCYTGTHDNNTIVEWFKKELNANQKKRLFDCLGHKPKVSEINWEMIRLALSSKANLVIIPVQDILGLGQSARMNNPAHNLGNWLWRLGPDQLTPQITKKLASLIFNR